MKVNLVDIYIYIYIYKNTKNRESGTMFNKNAIRESAWGNEPF